MYDFSKICIFCINFKFYLTLENFSRPHVIYSEIEGFSDSLNANPKAILKPRRICLLWSIPGSHKSC